MRFVVVIVNGENYAKFNDFVAKVAAKNSTAERVSKKAFPNPFRSVKNFFNYVFKRKPKFYRNGLAAVINSVTLSQTEVTTNCLEIKAVKSKNCSDKSQPIKVYTSVTKSEDDKILVYQYSVTGGVITGSGERVEWDLSNAKAGTYTITIGVDDGNCGVCGQPATRIVNVIECAECGAQTPNETM